MWRAGSCSVVVVVKSCGVTAAGSCCRRGSVGRSVGRVKSRGRLPPTVCECVGVCCLGVCGAVYGSSSSSFDGYRWTGDGVDIEGGRRKWKRRRVFECVGCVIYREREKRVAGVWERWDEGNRGRPVGIDGRALCNG